jgi:hypothetical protein
MSTGALKSMGYDHPSYTTRQLLGQSIMTAGSGGVSAKFVAHAAMILFGLNAITTVAGTSTYTYTQGGTATVAVAATQLSVIRITNTASAGATIGLSTTTYGPYTIGGQFINQGDQVYVVNGTDLSAVELVAIDYQIAPIIGGVMS